MARRAEVGRVFFAETRKCRIVRPNRRLLISLFVMNTHLCFYCPFSFIDTFFHAIVVKDFFRAAPRIWQRRDVLLIRYASALFCKIIQPACIDASAVLISATSLINGTSVRPKTQNSKLPSTLLPTDETRGKFRDSTDDRKNSDFLRAILSCRFLFFTRNKTDKGDIMHKYYK